MTDTATIEPTEDEVADLEAIVESLIDMVQNEPDHLLTMAQSVLAIHEINEVIAEHDDTGDARIVLRDIQKVLVKHGILEVRVPSLDEMADPDWWGHAEGVTSSDDIVCMSEDHADTLDAVHGALEMDGETLQ